jgi:hypothetical protein
MQGKITTRAVANVQTVATIPNTPAATTHLEHLTRTELLNEADRRSMLTPLEIELMRLATGGRRG